MPVLVRADKGLDHLGVDEVAVETVELIEPEVVALKVQSRLWTVVGVAMQVTKILHQHKGAVEFFAHDLLILSHSSQGPRSSRDVAGIVGAAKLIDRVCAFRDRRCDSGIGEERVDKLIR